MISQERAKIIEACMPVHVPRAEHSWGRIKTIDQELEKPMLPAIRLSRMAERKDLLNRLRISYT